MRVKNKKNVSPAQEEKKPVENSNSLAVLCATGVLAITSSACTAPSALTQVFAKTYESPEKLDRSEFEIVMDCPREAVEYMKKHGIEIGKLYESVWPDVYRGPALDEIPENEQVDLEIPFARTRQEKNKSLGRLPISEDTQGFTGPFVIYENRIHARFTHYNYYTAANWGTELRANQHMPVCMEAWYNGEPGVPYLGPGKKKDTVRTFARIQLKAVDHW